MAIDAVCMGLLAAAATVWEGTSREGHVSTAVIVLQLFTLIGEFIWAKFFHHGNGEKSRDIPYAFKYVMEGTGGFQLLLVTR